MAYDPFASKTHQPQGQTPEHYYNDSSADFNPYSDAPGYADVAGTGHQRIDSTYKGGSGSLEEDGVNERFEPGARGVGTGTGVGVGTGPGGVVEKDEFDPFQPPPKSTGDLRMWRHDHHGNLWVKGGRGRCVARFCCCGIMTAILLFVSIVLTLAMFLRPPDIEFSGITPTSDGSSVSATNSNLTVNLGIGISVRNPNFFSVNFKSIKASVTYPINNTEIGGGEEDHIVIASNSKTSFTFPFSIKYSEASDPDNAIIKDILNKCGFIAGSIQEDLTLGYKLTLAIQFLFITVSPPISGSASFACPFTLAEIKPLISSIPELAGLIPG